ncbi:LarC family nickel insertion protein [Niallia taxi]|uniref:LarC family nickel insertion protein n=1 Tax=Niallia taxi TaxID=2499688 RepID=UPI0015F63722|nr:LarC family nickel insertion protein [Niallia taxi]MED4040045.1 LarC family nickel insertion protein [Niallia taxi]
MKTLYFDCFSGISGDMVIGALIDAGADPEFLAQELKKLKIDDEYELVWKKVVKNGITSTKFDVILLDSISVNNIDDHSHEHTHSHDHSHDHSHEHTHSHGHSHHHRSYKDIMKLILEADLSDNVKNTALNIFEKIGRAEGHIHGMPLEQVHFHEVGAVDSIIDIVGAAILFHHLEVSVIKASAIPVGTGRIKIDHGIYPVPAPATLEILKGIPLEHTNIRGELTTPTGAAIVAALADEFCAFPSLKVQAIGYGAGTKTFAEHPNVLRVIIGEQA